MAFRHCFAERDSFGTGADGVGCIFDVEAGDDGGGGGGGEKGGADVKIGVGTWRRWLASVGEGN